MFAWPKPKWLEDLPEEQAESAHLDFILRLAALYASAEGTLSSLSEQTGKHHNSLHLAKHRSRLSPEQAIALESVLGREMFPRELFRPDIFSLPE